MLTQPIKHRLTAVLLAVTFAFSSVAYGKIIEDVKGNRIEIPDSVTRIADLWHANNQIVLLLGGADKLVATTTSISKNPWFNLVYPRIKEVPVLTDGQTVQTEELLQAKPDAALLSNAGMAEEVKKAGITPVLVSFQSFDGLKETVRITAEVIGGSAPGIAQEYINELEGNIRFVAERLETVKETDKPSVMHISRGSNLLMVDGGKSMIGDWIVKAGGRNALPEQANLVEVGMEEVLKANPDIIIIGSSNAKQTQEAIEKLKTEPVWQSINAVKNQRIYPNPSGTFPWDRYSAEEALQILWAAKLFHPERFNDVDMVFKTQSFYKKYYHYDLSEQNAEQILEGLPPIE